MRLVEAIVFTVALAFFVFVVGTILTIVVAALVEFIRGIINYRSDQ